MLKTPRRRRLVDAYAFPGFRAGGGMRGRFGDPQMRIVTLARRAKKRARHLWDDASQLLRSHTPPGARSVERTVSHLPRFGSAPGSLPPVCRGEARAAGVSGR